MYVWKNKHNNTMFWRFSKIYFKLKLLNYENKFTPISAAYHSYIHLKFLFFWCPEASTVEAYSKVVVNYSYSTSELETLKLINDYRVSVGLNVLERINYISGESEGHNNYMILTM
jgi:hypothetical protein